MNLRHLAAAAVMLILSACASRPPGPPPPPPVALLVPAASAASVALWQNSLAEATRLRELSELEAYPQLAHRAGTTLYIFRNGNVLTQRESDPQNCEGFDTCNVWFFSGALSLASEHGREDFARLIHTNGEGFGYSLVNGRGADVWIGGGTGLPAPDGRSIAAGMDEVDPLADGNRLMIVDWNGNIPPVLFAPSCLPLKWEGDQSFTARCVTLEGHRFEATAQRGPAGLWTLTEKGSGTVWQGEVLPPPM